MPPTFIPDETLSTESQPAGPVFTPDPVGVGGEREGYIDRMAARIKGLAENPTLSETVSIFRDSPPGVVLMAFDLINRGVNAAVTGPLGRGITAATSPLDPYIESAMQSNIG